VARILLGIVYGIDVQGRENIPQGAAMVCANHSNLLDPIFIAFAAGIDNHMHVIAKAELYKVPLLSTAIKKLGAIRVDRGILDVKTIKETFSYLNKGEKVAIFPEGTRNPVADAVAAKGGAVRIAEHAKVPIVPLYIPRRKPLLRKIHLVIGEPYYIEKPVAKRTPGDYSRLADVLMSRIEDLNPQRDRGSEIVALKAYPGGSPNIKVAGSAGFCYGVRRAVAMCESAAVKHQNCVMLGPIIHNEYVVRDLVSKGIRVVADVSELTPRDTVIIRSHGVGRNDHAAISATGANVIDATCPYVKKIHTIVSKESRKGRLPVIIGQRSHPEVSAISGWCDDYRVFETADALSDWLNSNENSEIPISVVFQTTITKAVYHSCVEIVKKVCTNHKMFDTICSATSERQQEAAGLSKTMDVMIVVGGKNSANSLRLADICREHCDRVVFVENADAFGKADIRTSDSVGITAGASTPAWIIKEVTQKMSEELRINEIENPESEMREPEVEEESQTDVIDPATVESISPDSGVEDPESVSDETEQQEPLASESESQESIPEESIPNEPIAEESDQQEVTVKDEPLIADESSDATDEDETSEAVPASESFEEMLEKSIKTLHTGEKVTGVVTSITSTEVSVDLGTKQSGYIPISEFTDDANSNIDDIIKVGDTIETFVMRVNDVEGMVMLSKKRLDAIKNWDMIEAAKDSKTIVEGFVTEENKGGVVVNVKGVRVFIPASQTGLPKSAPMSELVRKPVKLRVTEVNQSRRRVVGSIRAVQVDERRERSESVWNSIEAGKQYSGVVKSMTSYGVFVDIGGVDGMIHISELSWTRIKQPSDVMSVGDEVSVYVLSFDRDNRKISLGYKKNEDNPWIKFTSGHAVGDVVNVKIVKMMPFGAFAEIYPGVDGLIHISQISDRRIGLPSEVLSDGQSVDVKITEIDNDRKKVSLSIRALIDPSSQPITNSEAKEAALTDKAPVIVYDTDAPPMPDVDQ